MSYEVYIDNNSHSYTSNLSGFFREIMFVPDQDKAGLHVLHAKLGCEALPILKEAFQRAHYHDDLSTFDVPNGFGTAHGALHFLARIAIDCAMNPYKRISINS